MDWAQVLVIILAIVLAIFLILAITLVALLIKVTQQIKSVTTSAQRTVEQFEHTMTGARAATTPFMVMRAIMKHMKKSKQRKGK